MKIDVISYSKVLARQYGIRSAIILQYLAYCMKKQFNRNNWYFKSAADIAKRFFNIFPISTINNTLNYLVSIGVLMKKKAHRFNKDQTLAYKFMHDNYFEQALGKNNTKITLIADEIINYGLIEAVIIQNLANLALENIRVARQFNFIYTSARTIATFTGVTVSQLSRALSRLVKSGKLERMATKADKACYGYRFTTATDFIQIRLAISSKTKNAVKEQQDRKAFEIKKRQAIEKELARLNAANSELNAANLEIIIDYKNYSNYQTRRISPATQSREERIEDINQRLKFQDEMALWDANYNFNV